MRALFILFIPLSKTQLKIEKRPPQLLQLLEIFSWKKIQQKEICESDSSIFLQNKYKILNKPVFLYLSVIPPTLKLSWKRDLPQVIP